MSWGPLLCSASREACMLSCWGVCDFSCMPLGANASRRAPGAAGILPSTLVRRRGDGDASRPATQGESRNAGIGACAPGGGQTERLSPVVEVHPLGPSFSTDSAPAGVDTHTAHLRQVNHEPSLAHRGARDIVAATPYRYQKMVGAGEIDSLDHVGSPSAAGDKRGLAVKHTIPDSVGL